MSKILLGIHLDDAKRLEWNTEGRGTSLLHTSHEYAYKISTVRVLDLDTFKKEIEDIRYSKNIRLVYTVRFCKNTLFITKINDYTDKLMDDNVFIERVEQDILIPFGIKRVILNLDFGNGKHNVVFPKSLSELYLFAGSLSDCLINSKDSSLTLYVPSELEDLVMGKFKEIDYKVYNIDIKDSIIETLNSVGVLVKTY